MAVNSGTNTLSVTAEAVANQVCRRVSLHNNDGAINILVGNASAQNFTLGPGQSVTVEVTNANQVWVKSASATPVLSYLTS